MLEAAAVVAGLCGGVRAGFALRDSMLRAGAGDDDDMAPTDEGSSGLFQLGGRRRQRVEQPGATVTMMIVGDRRVGKTLFCSRLISEAERTASKSERGPTLTPTWRRTELSLPLDEGVETRVCFQVLDTPGRAELAELIAPFYRQAPLYS